MAHLRALRIHPPLIACVLSASWAAESAAQEWEWARAAGGAAYDPDIASAVAVDAEGRAIVTGRYAGTATFGAQTLTANGSSDVFLTKYAATGEALWAQSAGGAGADIAYGVAVAPDGHAYVAGTFDGTAAFGPFTLHSAGGSDVFLARYAPDGSVVWVRGGGGAFSDIGSAVAVDADGAVYIAGAFRGTASFGSAVLAAVGSYDVFLLKYDAGGDLRWALRLGGSHSDVALGLSADAHGVYVTGHFAGTADFGGVALTSVGGADIFLAAFTSDGALRWARRAGGMHDREASEAGLAVTADGEGGVYVTGHFSGAADFGPHYLVSAGREDAFVARYSAAGDALWARRGGSEASFDLESGAAVVRSPTGGVLVSGWFVGEADFGPLSLMSVGGGDAFVAHYSSEGDILGAVSAGGELEDSGRGIAVGPGGGVLVCGEFSGAASFGLYTLTSAGGADVYLARLEAPSTARIHGPGRRTPPGISVHPNPVAASATVTIDFPVDSPASVVLYDGLGRLITHVHHGPVAAGRSTIPIATSRLLPGSYLLRLRTPEETLAHRFTVTR